MFICSSGGELMDLILDTGNCEEFTESRSAINVENTNKLSKSKEEIKNIHSFKNTEYANTSKDYANSKKEKKLNKKNVK